MEYSPELITTDVLVIGGGIAGCLAAITAKQRSLDVTLVDKGNVGRSGNSPMMSGVLSVFDPELDDYQPFLKHCVETGEFLNDQVALQTVILGTMPLFRSLEDWGVEFAKKKGKLDRTPGIGSNMNARMSCGGLQLMDVVRGEVIRQRIRLVERVAIKDLLTSDGEHPSGDRVTGALGVHVRTGAPYIFNAKATVTATGAVGAGRVIPGEPSFLLSGDSIAAATRAGCELKNMELVLVSYHAAGFNIAPGANILLGSGAKFVNAQGERFMERYEPAKLECASRAKVSIAMAMEYQKGNGPVFLDATHLDNTAWEKINQAIPIIMKTFTKSGLDPRKDKIQYAPDPGSTMGPGGIRVTPERASTLPGLYACGSCGDHSEDGVCNVITHGMESAVGGQIAGTSAANYSSECSPKSINQTQANTLIQQLFSPFRKDRGIPLSRLKDDIQRIGRMVGLVRNQQTLSRAIKEIEEVKNVKLPKVVAKDSHDLVSVSGLENRLVYLEVLARSAAHRTESRGGHYRTDYPTRDDTNWLKWVIVKRAKDGIRVWDEPVPFERYPVKPTLTMKNAD